MAYPASTPPETFRISVPEATIADLQIRLQATRWTRPDSADDWKYGTSMRYLRDFSAYWLATYDWHEQQARLNTLAHFKARIEGAGIHFVHVPGRGPRPLPLLLLHGWPDSFLRFHKVIPMFTDPAGVGRHVSDVFDVVVPSLPGFAFTGAIQPVIPAVNEQPSRRSAHLLWRLMTETLGYDHFVVAGGDGGSVLAQIMAIDHPESVIGVHLTDLGWHVSNQNASSLPKHERAYLEAGRKVFMADGAYAAVHMTRPRSLTVGLNDSPVGLASWILDRFHSWCDFDRELEDCVSRDDLLTNIMLYWVTQTIGSAVFNYYADAQSPSLTPADHVNLPVGLALFPKDIGGVPPRSFAERTLNVQRWTEMPRGGHFGALEQPELFARDVIEFCRPLRAVQPRAEREESHGARVI